MRKHAVLLLLTLLLPFASCAAAANALDIDYDAYADFANSWNQAAEEAGLPLFFDATSENMGFSAVCYSDENQPTTIIDSLTNTDIPLYILMNYWADGDELSLIYAKEDLTEEPSALEFYIDGQKHEALIEMFPSESEDETDLYLLTMPMATVDGMLDAHDCFLRLTTDKDTYFLDATAETMPIPFAMMRILQGALRYSTKSSPEYLDGSLLWSDDAEDAPAPAVTEKPASFQTDYAAIDQAAQSVFLLEVYDEKNELISTGSGFVAFDSGTLITNEHVIEDAAYIIAHSDQYSASYKLTEVRIADREKDIAILVFDPAARIRPLTVDLQSRILRGQPVTAIGSPKGIINTVSSGNISNIVYYSESVPDYIQFTAPISPGSSGGALFNEAGAVIGLCVSYLREAEAMYYAIPMKYVEEMYQETKGNQAITLAKYRALTNGMTAPVLMATKHVRNGIELNWSVADYADSYEVYRSTEKESNFVLLATVEEPCYVDEQIEIGYTYWYQICAYNRWTGRSPVSNSRSAVIPVPTPTPIPTGDVIFSLWNVDPEIYTIKLRLYELGYYSAGAAFDNQYNRHLQLAVKTFQKANGLQTTSNIDQATFDVLMNSNVKPGNIRIPDGVKRMSGKSYQMGDKGWAVLDLKRRLQFLGYYRPSSDFDDEFNKTMVERLQEFQKKNDLEPTGVVDYITLIKLFYDKSAKGRWYVKSTPAPVTVIKLR